MNDTTNQHIISTKSQGFFQTLKTLWMSTIGVQPPSTLASEQTDLLKTLPTNLGNWMG